VLSQVTAHHVDAHGHALVTVQVQEEFSVVLNNLLQLLNAAWNTISEMLRQLPLSMLEPPLQSPQISLQLPPVPSPAKGTGGAWTDTA